MWRLQSGNAAWGLWGLGAFARSDGRPASLAPHGTAGAQDSNVELDGALQLLRHHPRNIVHCCRRRQLPWQPPRHRQQWRALFWPAAGSGDRLSTGVDRRPTCSTVAAPCAASLPQVWAVLAAPASARCSAPSATPKAPQRKSSLCTGCAPCGALRCVIMHSYAPCCHLSQLASVWEHRCTCAATEASWIFCAMPSSMRTHPQSADARPCLPFSTGV